MPIQFRKLNEAHDDADAAIAWTEADVWTQFACSVPLSTSPKVTAEHADKMMAEWRKRFVQQQPDEADLGKPTAGEVLQEMKRRRDEQAEPGDSGD